MAKGKRGDAGVVATNYRQQTTRWKIDYDYLRRLTPEERQWLAQFSDAHYGSDFRGDPEAWSVPERRKVYNAKNSERGDAYAMSGLGNCLGELGPRLTSPSPENDPRDFSDTPEYLNSDEYKRARDSFRETLSPHRTPHKPTHTPELERAHKRLETVTPYEDAPEISWYRDPDDETPPGEGA